MRLGPRRRRRCTAKTEAGDIRRGLELGADAYVTKPYSKSVLVDAIRQVLRVG